MFFDERLSNVLAIIKRKGVALLEDLETRSIRVSERQMFELLARLFSGSKTVLNDVLGQREATDTRREPRTN